MDGAPAFGDVALEEAFILRAEVLRLDIFAIGDEIFFDGVIPL